MGAAAALTLGVFTIAAPFVELVRELAVPLLAPVMIVIVQFAHLLATPLVVIMVVVHRTAHATHAPAHAALLTVITVLIVRTVLTGHAATGTAQAVAVPGALLAVTVALLTHRTHRRLAATKRTAALISAGIELAVLSLSACRRLMAHAMHTLLAAAILATLITLLITVLTALIALVSAVLAALMTLMAAILPTLETTLATVAARAV